MRKRKIIWLVMLVGAVLAATTWLLHAEAEGDDTYNFYFQKAPGPMTVNQGGAPGNANPAPSAPAATAAVPTPSPAEHEASTTASGHAIEDLPKDDRPQWSFSAGYTFARPDIWDNSSSGQNFLFDSVLTNQFTVGFGWNPTPIVGVEGNFYLLKEASNYNFPASRDSEPPTGSKADYSLGLVLTPLRFHLFSQTSFAIGGQGGVITVPHLDYTAVNDGSGPPSIQHMTTVYYGARATIGFSNHAEARVELRRIDKFDLTTKTLTLAYLF